MNEEGLEKWVQAYKRANRTEKSLIVAGLPTLILSFLYSLPGVGDWLKSYASVNKWLSIGLGVVSLVCFVYASYKVWSQPIKDQGKNPLGHLLKGGAKYTKAEGKLFWRLGRRAELSKVWSLISNADIPLIAIQGESGAGKSSLLQGGIEFLLSEEGYELLSLTEPIPCAYCEIRPGDPGADLLRRAGETLRRTGGAAGIEPATLEQFIALARSSRKRMVILLDQFEQLSLDDARHKPVFEFLGAIAKERTNHSITVVIAFRSEYASEWNQFLFQLDSQSGSGNQMAPLPLQLFKKEGKEGGRARDIVATLGKEANLNLAEIVDPLIEFIADKEGRVRPFDLSVSLKCLSELNQDTLQPSDLPPGGFPALLARFLRSRLYHLRDEEREAVFAAIHLKLTRTAYEGRQRVADGLSLEELAKDGGMAPHDLLGALRYLIDPEAGLLEKLPPAPGRAESRYRILHESFIPALQQLAGSALDKERQARRVFNDCWGAYDPAKPSERLLRRSDLKLVEQHWEQMDDLHSEPSKRDYYFISIQHRARSWLMAMAASVFVLVSGLFLLWSYNRERQVEHAHGLMRDWVLQVRTEEDREAYVKLRELAACNLHARLSVLTDVLEWPGDEKVPGLAHVIVGLDPQGSVTREAAALIISALASGKPALNAPDLVTQLRLATNDCLPLATAIVSRMKNPTNQLGDHDIAAFGNALASMTTNLPQEQCREAAVFLVSRMTNTTQRSFIKAHEIDALGRALASLAMNLPQGQRQSIAMPIISRMTNTTVRLDSQEVAALGGALAPLATSLLPEHRQSLAMLIVSRIASNTERLNNQEFAALGKALALLATNLPPEQHQSLAMPIVSRMTNTTERMDRDVDVALAKALASLGTNIPELTVTAATAIVSHVTSMTTGNYISPLGGVAVSLATNLPPEQLVPLASKITSHMTNATERLGSYGIAALGETLAPLAKDLQEQRVAAALALLFRMTNSTKRGTENYEIVRLAEALDLLAIDLPEHRATATTIMLD